MESSGNSCQKEKKSGKIQKKFLDTYNLPKLKLNQDYMISLYRFVAINKIEAVIKHLTKKVQD